MGLKIFATGGTFDKVYNPLTEELEFTETHIPEILKLGRYRNSVDVETLMLKDSLHMDCTDRGYILSRCQSSLEDGIVITHGTGTMVETAKVLGENRQSLDGKTIVLTGAMVPYSVKDSDALFNFAFAYCAAQLLPGGVYIAMNGRNFDWDNIRKNTETGEFEEIR
ncbi:asparaginase [Candidatus Woesearchaeota archaeon]|nr:asparaginase [Candidatus Woesearchaeota archaeon]